MTERRNVVAIKIHPGIGVGRVGDSPEYFVGPETPFDITAPAGGFRDGECRIKRQAALFRIYEHDADGTVHEITASATTTITWTVRIRKTAFDDPEVSLTGPGPVSVTATGIVYAELTTDASGRLILIPVQATIDLAGSSIDSRCEGYVEASVVRDGIPLPPIDSSWVVIYPPDFAPGVHPGVGAAGDLLPLWPGAPATSPALPLTDQLDRGPLTFVGLWDAGLAYGTLSVDAFAEPFRFPHDGPGSSLLNSYSSWSSDLFGAFGSSGCTTSSWLSGVAVDDATTVPTWQRGANAYLRGFLAEQSDASLRYVDWCPRITAPPEVNFYQVPQGTERAVPIRLELRNFPEATSVNASVVGQPNARLESTTWDTPVAPEDSSVPVTVWAFFRADSTTPLGEATGTIELRFDARHTVSIPLRAQVVAPTRVAVALVLDCSTSMDLPRGDRRSRLEGLKEAVNVYVDVARPGSAIAVAPFSTTELPALPARILGNGDAADEGTGGARKAVRDFVAARGTVDLTSIGAGLQSGQHELDEPAVAAFEAKALVVVTDGWQTAWPYISDVASSITDRMFAIGVGSVFDDALREIVGVSGGYVTITGPVTGTTRFDLEKYLLQAVAAIAGDTLSDPEGELAPGAVHSIPFTVSDADLRLDLIVISDRAQQLSIGVQGPTGAVWSLEELRATGRCRVTRTARVGHVELDVPFDTGAGIWLPGAWNLVVANVESPPWDGSPTHAADSALPNDRGKPAHYLAMVTTSSALRLIPSIRRFANEVVFEAAISYGGAPVLKNPLLVVDLTTPWGAMLTLPLVASGPGLFRGRLETSRLGRYRATFRARGTTFAGLPFQRERLIEEVFVSGDQLRPDPDPCACLSRLMRSTKRTRGLSGKLSYWLEKLCREQRG